MTLKHGNVFLLSDQFGDVHPDSRGLGLYQDDTRIVSRVELRVNGLAPGTAAVNVAANYRGTIQLTNPDIARNPGPDAEAAVDLLAPVPRDRARSNTVRRPS